MGAVGSHRPPPAPSPLLLPSTHLLAELRSVPQSSAYANPPRVTLTTRPRRQPSRKSRVAAAAFSSPVTRASSSCAFHAMLFQLLT